MTALRNDPQGPIRIVCDEPDCGEIAPEVTPQDANGLIGLGWQCSGGTHYCPAHRREP